MYDMLGSYTCAFFIAGLPPIIFGILLTTTQFVKKRAMEQVDKALNEPSLLSPVPEIQNTEGKHSTIVNTTAEHTLLLSKTINPWYTH